jgi:hypothetical protein
VHGLAEQTIKGIAGVKNTLRGRDYAVVVANSRWTLPVARAPLIGCDELLAKSR